MMKHYFESDQYQLTDIIAKGSFGEVYYCQDMQGNLKYAAKLEKTHYSQKILQEVYICQKMDIKCVFLSNSQINCMIMPLYNTNLLQYIPQPYEIDNQGTLIKSLLLQLQKLHSIGFVHRDIKPQNIVLNSYQDILLIDFGLSKRYIDVLGKYVPMQQTTKQFVGTSIYAPLSAHLGLTQYPKDDLESLAYTLMYIFNGTLPWKNLQSISNSDKYKQIRQMKLKPPENLNAKGPYFLTQLFHYSRKLLFSDQINYDYLIDLLENSTKS